MDGLAKENILYKVTKLLNLDFNSFEDEVLEIYIDLANDYILNRCRIIDVPPALHSTIIQMVIHDYRKKGVENIKNESKGRVSQGFINEYPPHIENQLAPYKRIRVI